MKFHLVFSCDNSAFDPDPKPEIIHILKKFIENLSVFDHFPISIFDTNGNRIGGCNLVPSEMEDEKR